LQYGARVDLVEVIAAGGMTRAGAWPPAVQRVEQVGDGGLGAGSTRMSSSTTKAEIARSRSSLRTSTSRIDRYHPERAV